MAITQLFTFFTVPGETNQLYATNATDWQIVRLRLETAGPVAVGTTPELFPVGNGRGILLPATGEVVLNLPPASRLYIASDAINRVAVQIEEAPWLRQIMEAELAQVPATSSSPAPAGGNAPVHIGQWGYDNKKLPPSVRKK